MKASDSPTGAQRFASIVAEEKRTKSSKAALLEPFRAVLVREKNAGTSTRILVQSLDRVGVSISEESLRLWFLRQQAKGKESTSAEVAPRLLKPSFPASLPTISAGPRIAREDI